MDERIHNGTRASASRLRGTVNTATIRKRLSRAPRPEPVVPTGQGISPSLARRVLDIVIAVTILAMGWPAFLVLTAATRLSTGGSAIYRQRRVGQGSIPFTLYKFRTMQAEMTGPGYRSG